MAINAVIDWKPIKSAPKDGSRVLLFDQYHGAIIDGRWRTWEYMDWQEINETTKKKNKKCKGAEWAQWRTNLPACSIGSPTYWAEYVDLHPERSFHR